MNLIRRNGAFPPGGYPYSDDRTGKNFPGMEGEFDEQAREWCENNQDMDVDSMTIEQIRHAYVNDNTCMENAIDDYINRDAADRKWGR